MNVEKLNRVRNAALAFIIAAGLSFPITGHAFAADNDSDDSSPKAKDKLNNLFTDEEEDNTPTKSESVYVFANADGSVKNTVVTNWLKNTTKAKRLHDISALSDIQNTEGGESFDANGQSLVWDAQGNDIYYQGNTDKAVPVELKVTYWLDGKETDPADMAGKSGHVRIRFAYQNNAHSVEYVNGAACTVYVPFVCITGTVLDNKVFSNIATKNAKAINDGDRTLVGGYALPGLQTNLDLSEDDLDIPDYFEVEADAKNFEMGTTVTLVSSSLLDNLNTDELDTSEVGDALNGLSDGMGQLVDGTSKLYDGMKQLDSGGQQLASGTAELSDNTAALPESAKKLAQGAAALATGTGTLAEGTNELAEGLGDATDGSEALIAGNKQISDGLNRLVNGTTDAEGNKTSPGLKDAADSASQIRDGVSALAEEDGALDRIAAAQTGLASSMTAASGAIAQYVESIDTVKDNLSQAQTGLDEAGHTLDGLAPLTSLKDGIDANEQAAGNTAAAAQATVDALDAIDVNSIEDEDLKAAIVGAQTAAEDTAKAANQTTETAGQLAVSAAEAPDAQAIAALGESISSLSTDISQAVSDLDAVENGDGTASDPGLSGIAQSLSDAADGADAIASTIGDVKSGLTETAGGLDQLGSGLDGAVQAIGNEEDSAAQQGKNPTLLGGNNDVTSGLESLNSGLASAEAGAGQLAEGADSLDKGADALSTGLKALRKSAPMLAAGIEALNAGTSQLSEGIGAATDGTKQLAKGLSAFNDEGIQKILDAYHDNLDGLTDRLKATTEAGKRYDTFSGKSDGMKGSVKFIYETEAIERQ
ncbi:MAG: hypothetical protein Q4C36_07780 [Coriobacteriia bacterium]|nr:hypothetical protein [Coriobacteriia bacterium]